MKRLIVSLLFAAVTAVAQPTNPPIVLVTIAPTGSCANGLPDQQVVTTGDLYTCQSGSWAEVAAATSGAITPSSVTTSALTVNALTTPTTPALTITGGASGSYTYFVYALDNTGTNYSASAGVATTSGPTTLGVSNTIRVNCPAAVTGQVGSYEVVRSAGGTNQGIIGTCAGSGSLTDNGISATSTTKTASTNTTGYSLFPGPVGIGAASPYTPLDVVGIVRSDRVVNSQYVQMNGGDSNGMYISAVSGSGNKNFSITNNDPNGNLTLNAGSTAGALYLNAGGITGVTVSDLGAVVIGNGSIPLYVCSGGTFDGLFATAAAKCTGGSGTATKLSLQ